MSRERRTNDLEPIDYDENEAEYIEGTPDKRRICRTMPGPVTHQNDDRPRRWPLYIALAVCSSPVSAALCR